MNAGTAAALVAAAAGLSLPAGAQGIPPVLQGVYNQCRADCMQRVEKGTIRGAPKPQAPFDERAGFCRFTCHCTTERMSLKSLGGVQRGDSRELATIENACISQYTPPANDSTKLTRQRVGDAGTLYSFGEADPGDRKAVKDHLWRFRAQALDCSYSGLGAHFWYEKVPISQAELVTIARSHPLLRLGNEALKECPKTLGEAKQKLRAIGGGAQAQK